MALPFHRNRPPIPQEVIDLILGEVHNNIPTLMACSLVSSAFCLSRRLLYATITIMYGRNGRYEQFHKLSEENPALPTYVRKLRIHSIDYGPDALCWEDEVDEEYTIPTTNPITTLSVVLKSLRNLRSLVLHAGNSIQWCMLDTGEQNMFIEVMASAPLRSISIINITWPLSSFVQCTHLRKLKVDRPGGDCDLRHKADLVLLGTQLEVVKFGDGVDMLSATFGASYPSLRSFSIKCTTPPDVLFCQEVFRSATDTLEKLQISIGVSAVSEPFQVGLPVLRHLSVDFAKGTGLAALRWIFLFLENVAGHSLESLVLSVHGDVQTFNDSLWNQIYALLIYEPHFPHLYRVEVSVLILYGDGDDHSDWRGPWQKVSEALDLLKGHLVSNSRVEFHLTSPQINDRLRMMELYDLLVSDNSP